MSDLFLTVKEEIQTYLADKDFTLRGGKFVRKKSPFKREECIILYSRRSRPPYDYVEITALCNIYYKEVNALDKKIVTDFSNSYPIIAGSIGYFKEHEPNYFSINIANVAEVNNVVQEIIKNITEGAFNLFNNIFPTLESIVEGIRLKKSFLRDYIEPSLRESARVAAMLYLTENKENALAWFENSAPNEKDKSLFLEKMKNNWK
ncbi:MAG: hypothetical protein LBL13_11190 [Bacteroidales bacterium]|jgi:hypothetical protein|nr:hypothetical protein [Bacteroidales bacterium]